MRVEKKSFMKGVLRLAFFNVITYQIWHMVVFTLYQVEAPTLTEKVYQFWGLEVALLMLKTIVESLANSKSKDEEV